MPPPAACSAPSTPTAATCSSAGTPISSRPMYYLTTQCMLVILGQGGLTSRRRQLRRQGPPRELRAGRSVPRPHRRHGRLRPRPEDRRQNPQGRRPQGLRQAALRIVGRAASASKIETGKADFEELEAYMLEKGDAAPQRLGPAGDAGEYHQSVSGLRSACKNQTTDGTDNTDKAITWRFIRVIRAIRGLILQLIQYHQVAPSWIWRSMSTPTSALQAASKRRNRGPGRPSPIGVPLMRVAGSMQNGVLVRNASSAFITL